MAAFHKMTMSIENEQAGKEWEELEERFNNKHNKHYTEKQRDKYDY